MSDDIKKTEAVVEEDRDYKDLLDKFENPSESASSAKKKNNHIKALVICIVAAVVLAGAGAVLLFMPQDNSSSDTSGSAAVKTEVGKDKVREVKIKTDSNGKIKENGSGELVGKVPADIKTINIKNNSGNYIINAYTPKKKTKETDPDTGKPKYKTEATVYTLVGYEGFDLQAGIPDEIANACSTLSFKSVSAEDASSNLADFGMDKPRAVANITFTDGTKSVIKVGSDAAQKLGTYVMYGSGKTVYLCDTDTTSKLLYPINKYISTTINKSVTDENKTKFSSLSLSGSKFKNTITLKPNPDTKHFSSEYLITSPANTFADETEASTVSGAIRGLIAESVAAVKNFSLSKYGLASPYAKLTAKYSDTTVSLLASKPDSKGNCYIMKQGGNVIYKIGRASIPWVDTSAEKLVTKYVFKPELSSLKQMSVTCGGKTYDFDIKTTVTKTTDDNGEETSSSDTKTKYNDIELDEGNFETFFSNANLLTKADKTANTAKGNPALVIKYTYESGRNPDTVSFYKNGSKYIAVENSKPVGTVYSNYIEKLISQTPKVTADKEVKTFW